MKYYIFIENDAIQNCGNCPQINEEVMNIEVSEEVYNEFAQNPDMYVWDTEKQKVIENPNYEEEQRQKERERIAKLTMTPLDFINFLVESGLTLEQINAYLEANLSVKMQLTYCRDVFCGVACSLMPITIDDITITEDMVIEAFKMKHGEIAE